MVVVVKRCNTLQNYRLDEEARMEDEEEPGDVQGRAGRRGRLKRCGIHFQSAGTTATQRE